MVAYWEVTYVASYTYQGSKIAALLNKIEMLSPVKALKRRRENICLARLAIPSLAFQIDLTKLVFNSKSIERKYFD